MPDDIEVNVGGEEKKDETPVSFVESDGDTMVTVGEEKKEPSGGQRDDGDRWRRAEEDQLRLRADFADLRATIVGGGMARQPSAPATDPWKSQEDAIADRERALGIQWEAHKAARTLTPQLLKDFDQQSRDLQQERINIATQRAVNGALPQILQASQAQRFQSEYSDVRSNPAANRWARGHYDILVSQGAPESEDTVRQAMNAARVQFRMASGRHEPTERDRQQLTGFAGNTRRNVDRNSNVVKMGKAEKGMAMAMYGDRYNGDEKKAYAQWAKGPGIRAQKAAQKARRSNQYG